MGRNSRVLVSLAMLVLTAALSLISAVAVHAQDEDLARAREGRLGGTHQTVEDRFGSPDWTEVGLVGYNAAVLNGIETIVVAYFDDAERIYKMSLVYLEKPAVFDTEEDQAKTVLEVLPTDSECTVSTKSTGLGPVMHRCKSESAKGLFSAEELAALGVKGDDGYFNYSVDPKEDEYFEIIVQFGTDSFAPTPTPEPTSAPEPTPTPSLESEYPPVADVRELAIGRGFSFGDKLSVTGYVFNIEVDGNVTGMQIWVGAPDGSEEAVYIVYEGDTTGVFEGTWVTAYGTYGGPICGTNAFGGEICQPLVGAEVLLY